MPRVERPTVTRGDWQSRQVPRRPCRAAWNSSRQMQRGAWMLRQANAGDDFMGCTGYRPRGRLPKRDSKSQLRSVLAGLGEPRRTWREPDRVASSSRDVADPTEIVRPPSRERTAADRA